MQAQKCPRTTQILGDGEQSDQIHPHLAEMTKPLRELLLKKNTWYWAKDRESEESNDREIQQETQLYQPMPHRLD